MAITKLGTDQTSSQDEGTTHTDSYTLVAGSDRKLIVCVGTAEPSQTEAGYTVAYDGNTMTKAVDINSPGGADWAAIFYLNEDVLGTITNAAHDVVADFDGEDVDDSALVTFCLQDVAQGVPKDTDSASADTGDPTALSVSAVATDWTIMLGNSSVAGSNNWTWDSGSDEEIADFRYGPGNNSCIGVNREAGETAPQGSCFAGRWVFMAIVVAEPGPPTITETETVTVTEVINPNVIIMPQVQD